MQLSRIVDLRVGHGYRRSTAPASSSRPAGCSRTGRAPTRVPRAGSYIGPDPRPRDPRDLPIEHPYRFELVVDLKTARALGSRCRNRSSSSRPRPAGEAWRSLLRSQSVADAGLGEDVARASRIDLELAPELGHVHAQVVGLFRRAFGPQTSAAAADGSATLPAWRTSVVSSLYSIGVRWTAFSPPAPGGGARSTLQFAEVKTSSSVSSRSRRRVPQGHAHAGEQFARRRRACSRSRRRPRRARRSCRAPDPAPTGR